MKLDAGLTGPALHRTYDIIRTIQLPVGLAWLAAAVLGIGADLAVESSAGIQSGNGVLIVYGIALTFVQVWLTRSALRAVGFMRPAQGGSILDVYLQSILTGLATLVGLLLLVLPGAFLFARWYLAATILVQHGGGRRAAMGRSWDLLESHWPAALGVGLIMFVISVAPFGADLLELPILIDYPLATIIVGNMLAAVGVIGGYVSAVALFALLEPPAGELQEIFG
ncbi:MAG: hypothetical protein HEQ22_06615 [Sphingopyxis sp.]|uniref:hypothetical protein n=1 Tax=Sphingopyxis sp. TaxID=1908224 RepID=UPI003D80BF77